MKTFFVPMFAVIDAESREAAAAIADRFQEHANAVRGYAFLYQDEGLPTVETTQQELEEDGIEYHTALDFIAGLTYAAPK